MPIATPQSTPKHTDSKGRVSLGALFANRTVLLQRISDTVVLVKLARVIPEDELWLHRNAEAMQSVQEGIRQAREGKFAKTPPNLEADAALADSIEDD